MSLPIAQNALEHLHTRRCNVARQAAHELWCIQLEFAELLQRAEGPPHPSAAIQPCRRMDAAPEHTSGERNDCIFSSLACSITTTGSSTQPDTLQC